MNNRKEEILLTALHLFAQNGYEAVSVSQIAGELGITKGALYRHYQNKRDIFDHIVLRMEQGDSEQAADYLMPQEKATVDLQQKISVKQFISYSKSMFEYWTEEDFASSFRKMLTLEQFRNAKTLSTISGCGSCRICKSAVCKYGDFRSTGKCKSVLRNHVFLL